jgi:hypothetical protein
MSMLPRSCFDLVCLLICNSTGIMNCMDESFALTGIHTGSLKAFTLKTVSSIQFIASLLQP